MLQFQFDIVFYEGESEVHGLSLGNMAVQDEATIISSESIGPMMIFPSLTLLLDGIYQFLKIRTGRQFHFYAIDSSFGLKFFHTKEGVIKIAGPSATISRVLPSELVIRLWEGVQELITKYNVDITGFNENSARTEEIAMNDFKRALLDFQRSFAEVRPHY